MGQTPRFLKCLQMMRKRDPQVQEDGFQALLPHAGEHVEELLAAFEQEPDHGLRCWFLELLGAACSERTLGLFSSLLTGPDESFRGWAAMGLRALDTNEARTVLWNAKSAELRTVGETERFRRMLAELKDRLR